jgi:putative two-component system response regulator
MNEDRALGSRILVVDDNTENAALVERMLQWAGYSGIHCISDSRKAVGALRSIQAHLVVLDLLMPHVDGYQLLSELRSAVPNGDSLPILVFTGDASPEAKSKALQLGATDFLTKPCDPVELRLRVRNALNVRHLHLSLQDEIRLLEDRVCERTAELDAARREMLEVLAKTVEYRDDDTGEHVERIGVLSGLVGARLGMDAEHVELMGHAARLHDIGKVAVPEAILWKPGKLTADEYDQMKRHTIVGGQILASGNCNLLKMARQIALSHHERWDGGGYCEGLRQRDIPLAARIVAAVDVFDTLTHTRPYKEAWPVAEALAEISRQSGQQFDPSVVEALMGVVPTLQT